MSFTVIHQTPKKIAEQRALKCLELAINSSNTALGSCKTNTELIVRAKTFYDFIEERIKEAPEDPEPEEKKQ